MGLLLCSGYSDLTILIEIWVNFIGVDIYEVLCWSWGSSVKIDETWFVVVLRVEAFSVEVEASCQ